MGPQHLLIHEKKLGAFFRMLAYNASTRKKDFCYVTCRKLRKLLHKAQRMSDVRGATVAGQTPIPLSLFKEQGTLTPTRIATTPPSSINTTRLPSRPVTVLTVIPCWKNRKQNKLITLIYFRRKDTSPSPPKWSKSLTTTTMKPSSQGWK